MRAVVFTLGCKVNEVESAGIMASLEAAGWEVSDRLSFADVYVLNTCAVTREAEKKSRQLVARVRKFNPDAAIFICGCASEKDAAAFTEKEVAFVCGARKKDEVLKAIAARYGFPALSSVYPKQTKTRAFIKVQDGCNNFCSYCVIPYLRGRERSRPIEDVCGEIAACACPEIVLNGINLSAYRDGNRGLAELIQSLRGVEKRIRLGSLECNVIDEKLLSALQELPDFAEQFHLSLQSGSTAVLKSMNRHYTREGYLEKCALIYRYFPDAAITTDIIAGFPTETEQDFAQSLSMVEEAGLARVHAFAFSPREGTAAYRMKDLPPEVKSERLHRLLSCAKRAEEKYIARFLGRRTDFIAEEFDGEYTTGTTGNYLKIYVQKELAAGVKVPVRLKEFYKDGAIGIQQ